jgi:hypothetical protein
MLGRPSVPNSMVMERIAVVRTFLIGIVLLSGARSREAPRAASPRDAGQPATPPSVIPVAPIFPPATLRPASPGNCVEVICARLPGGSCSPDQLVPVAQMCGNQYSGECIADVCDRLGPFACDDVEAIKRIAPGCRNQIGAGCLRSVCRLAGPLGCDDLQEMIIALSGCSGNADGVCVDLVCNRLGPSGCDKLEKAARIARVCAGGG